MSSDDGNPFRIREIPRRPVLPPSGISDGERAAWYAEHERLDAVSADKWWNERGHANAAYGADRQLEVLTADRRRLQVEQQIIHERLIDVEEIIAGIDAEIAALPKVRAL